MPQHKPLTSVKMNDVMHTIPFNYVYTGARIYNCSIHQVAMVNSSMGLNTSCSFVQLLILALGCIRIRAQRTSDERPFPECDTQSCGMVGCREGKR